MDFGLGEYAGFIVSAYATVVVVVGALIVWIMLDERRQRRLLDELESEGYGRRGRMRQANGGEDT